jgi:hypothetical protein
VDDFYPKPKLDFHPSGQVRKAAAVLHSNGTEIDIALDPKL